MIHSWGYDVECFPNMFSVTFVDMKDYFDKFSDCVNEKGKPIPLTEKLTANEIKDRLKNVNSKIFWISDKDDSQLLSLVGFINSMIAKYETKIDKNGVPYQEAVRYDLFGFNCQSYDDIMIKAFLMYYNMFDKPKYLLDKLKSINDKIIKLQNDKDLFYEDKELQMIRHYNLPYATVDVQRVYGLNSATVSIDKDTGERQKFGKSLKQTSINLKWYNLLDFELPSISKEEYEMYYANNSTYSKFSLDEVRNLIVNDFDRCIMPEYIQPMLDYNINDVFIVCEMARLKPDEIKLRYSITSAFGINVLCSARSNIADKLTVKFYSDISGLSKDKFIKDRTERTKLSFNKIIFDHIQFKTPQLQALLEDMKKVVIYRTTKDAFCRTVEFYGTTYTLATGGIHSVDPPRVCKSNDKYIYRHHD